MVEKKNHISMTKRKFMERLKEHRSHIKNHKQSSALSTFYTNDIGHRIDFESTEVIVQLWK